MFSVGYVLLVLQSQLHNDDAWRQQDFQCYVGGRFAIRSVKPRTVTIVIVAECFVTSICSEQHEARFIGKEKLFSAVHVSIVYVLDTTDVVQRDDAPSLKTSLK